MRVSELFEARVKGGKYSVTQVKGKLDRITLELKGKESSSWTRISKQYKELDEELKKLEAKRNELNHEIKDRVRDVFDAEDDVLTRVVETINLTVTVSKKTKKPSVEKVDAEAVVKALAEADLPGELRKMVNELIKANTYMTKETETPERLTVDVKEAVSFAKIKSFISGVVSKIKAMFKGFDGKLSKIEKMAEAL